MGDGADDIERKATRVNFKSVNGDGTFEGYASLFGAEDLGHDVVMPGAFRGTLRRRGHRGVKLLYQHDPLEPIGVWTKIAEDGRGLFVQGQLLGDVARGREVLSLMRAGAIDGLSIGYHVVKAQSDKKTGLRRLIEVDLWEISVVTFPMLPQARISAVKNEEARISAGKNEETRTSPVRQSAKVNANLARAFRVASRIFKP